MFAINILLVALRLAVQMQMKIATVAKIQLSKNQSLSKERTKEQASLIHLIFIIFEVTD